MAHSHRCATRIRLPDGVRLHVELYRSQADRTAGRSSAAAGDGGLTVVLLHGWTLDRRLWQRQLADLPQRLSDQVVEADPVRMLAFDLRGHGRSDATTVGAATIEQLADDLAEVLRQPLADGRVVLVGHSLGGMAVIEYAHRHPDEFARRVAGVVLVNTSAEGAAHTTYGLPAHPARAVRLLELHSTGLLARLGPWNPHRHVMPLLGPAIRWLVFGRYAEPAWIRLVADMVAGASLRSIGAFRPAIDLHRRTEALAVMREVPVSVLVGALDRLTPPTSAAAITAELPHARLHLLAGAGHMLPMERSEVVTDAVAGVCREALATGPPGKVLELDGPPAEAA